MTVISYLVPSIIRPSPIIPIPPSKYILMRCSKFCDKYSNILKSFQTYIVHRFSLLYAVPLARVNYYHVSWTFNVLKYEWIKAEYHFDLWFTFSIVFETSIGIQRCGGAGKDPVNLFAKWAFRFRLYISNTFIVSELPFPIVHAFLTKQAILRYR